MAEVNLKKIVAEKAVDEYVKDVMNVGLGTGSTAYYAILRIAEKVKEGYDLTCVATSVQSEELAKENGIKVVSLSDVDHLDVTIDGADEVDDDMQLIKGLGGALLREKIVAHHQSERSSSSTVPRRSISSVSRRISRSRSSGSDTRRRG